MRHGPSLLLVLACVTTASAHDTWLLPAKARVQPGEVVAFELTSAGEFPRPESAVRAERLVARSFRVAGATNALEPRLAAKVLRLSAKAGGAGIATAWIETRPRTLELKPSQVLHYLEEIGALDTAGAEWKKSGQAAWRESYVKIAKAYVRVGEPVGDRSWAEPLGLTLEIVPEKDPTDLRPGDELCVRILFDGRSLPGLSVGAVAAFGSPVLKKTDAEGRVSFVLDRPGAWLVRATHLRPAGGQGRDWSSHFTTLTFDVGPAAATPSGANR